MSPHAAVRLFDWVLMMCFLIAVVIIGSFALAALAYGAGALVGLGVLGFRLVVQ